MAIVDGLLLAAKFRGGLLGSLIGDCLGAPYEGDVNISKVVLQQYFNKLGGSYTANKVPYKPYTDDTAMTKCVASSLIAKGGLDPQDLAKRFVVEYFNDPRRGYGHNVKDVFSKLRAQKFEDPFGPAREQFDGAGSLGNGAAMRIAPLALFYHQNYEELVEKAKLSAQITHTHKLGVDGTVLQAAAVYQSLQANPKQNLDVKEFSKGLLQKMAAIEKDEEGLGLDDPHPYQTQLKIIQDLLAKEDGATDRDVQKLLGNSVAAQFSVPTAIFCFLRAQESIPDIETENPFQRTIQYAISLGGDTDTIASVAGAIAGAFYGSSVINDSFIKHCESSEEIIKLADELYDASIARSAGKGS
ncbi:ADP-ribosylhydrolase ARH3 [Anabrus simplex]|uniref:ADP-ribosylhydrolase ARH3 n=1 Tax=Anabrus simplex TaxID=316456 RepID=UPI0035A345CF